MEAEIDDLDAVPDELQVDGVDRAIVAVTDRDGGQEADRMLHTRPFLKGSLAGVREQPQLQSETLRAVTVLPAAPMIWQIPLFQSRTPP